MTPEQIIKTARQRMDEAFEADIHNREMAEDDLRMVAGYQWHRDIRSEREADGKPCFTINQLPQFLRQVTAQIRTINPSLKVTPSDNGATDDVAEIYAGVVRDVEQTCDGSSIYEKAAESAATCGIGHWRIRSDYCDEYTFDQKLVLEYIHNPFAVFWDPLARDSTRKDARFCFIAEDMDKAEFAAAYPNATASDFTTQNRPTGWDQWYTADTVTVAEYFWIDHEEYTIWQVGGVVVRDLPPGFPKEGLKTRKVRKPKCMWAKVSFTDVLEGPTELPCSSIPVFAVTGEEIHTGETVFRSSVVRFAKDPQQLYNYSRSVHAEVVALQPKAPYIGTAKQFQGFEAFWNEANRSSRPYLPYNPDEKAPGAPQRQPPPVSSQGVMAEIQLAAEDMKRTTGIYDASLGAKSNETSGVAIERRQIEAQAANSLYADNMVKAILQCGKVMVEMIPRVYDGQRVLRIVGEDNQEKAVIVNQIMIGPDGPVIQNDMTSGRYDVRVSVGPSHQTAKQEAAANMLEFMRTVPQSAPLIADLVAKSQEWQDSERIAERLRRALPPGLAEEDDAQENPQAAQMQAMQQQQMMAAQQAQAAMAQEMQKMELHEARAKAAQAEANATKAQHEATKAELEIRAMTAGMMVPVNGPI